MKRTLIHDLFKNLYSSFSYKSRFVFKNLTKMITDDLYNTILIEPAKNGCDELFIVSGYSSASFLRRHMNAVKEINE